VEQDKPSSKGQIFLKSQITNIFTHMPNLDLKIIKKIKQ
jgi:hypothetical protein